MESLQTLPLPINSAYEQHFQVQVPPINLSNKVKIKMKQQNLQSNRHFTHSVLCLVYLWHLHPPFPTAIEFQNILHGNEIIDLSTSNCNKAYTSEVLSGHSG